MKKFRLMSALLAGALVIGGALPAMADGGDKSQAAREQHAVEFVRSHPDIYTNPETLKQYIQSRNALLTGHKNATGKVSPYASSFDYVVTDIYGITVNTKIVDNQAYPIWENTIMAQAGSGGANGTWSATWSKQTSSKWYLNGSFTAEAGYKMFTKLALTVGGGYERTTTTSWSGTTTVNFSVPEGYQQTLYAYEKGTHWNIDCDCQISMSSGSYRTTISGASHGLEAYPYQATTFIKGPILPY